MSNPNLFSTYTSANQLTSQGLTVTYDQQYTSGYYTVTRYARKQYSYIGLTEEAAYACAAAKRSQYTRYYKRLDTSGDTPTIVSVVCCGADVTPQHDSGCTWSVTISVSETDVKYSAEIVSDMATLFASENGRSYDDTGAFAALSLDSVTRNGTIATYSYTQNIGSDFDSSRMKFQYKTSPSSTSWTSSQTVPESGTIYCRLVYGAIESNTLTVE